MSKYNRCKGKRDKKTAIQASRSQSADVKMIENYTVRDGFLYKGDTSVSLVTSGLVETVKQGFLHVDETEKYKP